MLGIRLMVGLVIVGQAQTREKDVTTPPWAVIVKRHAMAAKVYARDDPAHPFAPLKEPVLNRMQEVTGSSKGSVFVWVDPSGRPAAICDVFLYFEEPGRYSLNNEWHSLSGSPLRAESSHRMLFNATRPGLEWKPIPNAPLPADTRPGRDRQVRHLAERFSADLLAPKNDRFHLRLLTTPLHRYDTNDSLDSRDGALFAFCQQTDRSSSYSSRPARLTQDIAGSSPSLGSPTWFSTCTSTGVKSGTTSPPPRAAVECTATHSSGSSIPRNSKP